MNDVENKVWLKKRIAELKERQKNGEPITELYDDLNTYISLYLKNLDYSDSRKGGKGKSSEARKMASAINGKLGGRPKKNKEQK